MFWGVRSARLVQQSKGRVGHGIPFKAGGRRKKAGAATHQMQKVGVVETAVKRKKFGVLISGDGVRGPLSGPEYEIELS